MRPSSQPRISMPLSVGACVIVCMCPSCSTLPIDPCAEASCRALYVYCWVDSVYYSIGVGEGQSLWCLLIMRGGLDALVLGLSHRCVCQVQSPDVGTAGLSPC